MQDDFVYTRNLQVNGTFTGVSLTAASLLTAATGLSVTAGGLTVTAGGESITAGGLTVTGGIVADKIAGGTAAVQTIATSGGTISIGAKVAKVAQTTGGTVTGCSLVTAAAVGGQELHIINENVAGASTLIINSGLIVASGTTAVTISGLAGKKFIYDDTQSLWVAE